MTLQLLILCAAAALAFAGVRWGLGRLAANGFLIDFLSLLAALLVFASHSLLGVAL
jgi:hypothetical protein